MHVHGQLANITPEYQRQIVIGPFFHTEEFLSSFLIFADSLLSEKIKEVESSILEI
jgi:hypothetical protein